MRLATNGASRNWRTSIDALPFLRRLVAGLREGLPQQPEEIVEEPEVIFDLFVPADRRWHDDDAGTRLPGNGVGCLEVEVGLDENHLHPGRADLLDNPQRVSRR